MGAEENASERLAEIGAEDRVYYRVEGRIEIS